MFGGSDSQRRQKPNEATSRNRRCQEEAMEARSPDESHGSSSTSSQSPQIDGSGSSNYRRRRGGHVVVRDSRLEQETSPAKMGLPLRRAGGKLEGVQGILGRSITLFTTQKVGRRRPGDFDEQTESRREDAADDGNPQFAPTTPPRVAKTPTPRLKSKNPRRSPPWEARQQFDVSMDAILRSPSFFKWATVATLVLLSCSLFVVTLLSGQFDEMDAERHSGMPMFPGIGLAPVERTPLLARRSLVGNFSDASMSGMHYNSYEWTSKVRRAITRPLLGRRRYRTSAMTNEPPGPKLDRAELLNYTYTDPWSGHISQAPLAPTRSNWSGGFWSWLLGRRRPRAFPPVVFYATVDMKPFQVSWWQRQWRYYDAVYRHNHTVLDPLLRVNPGEEPPEKQNPRPPLVEGDCVPMKLWQTASLPSCNNIHELDLLASGGDSDGAALPQVVDEFEQNSDGLLRDANGTVLVDDNIRFLTRGWFRHIWRVDLPSKREAVVLKTLRLEREFYDEYYDLHRKDAMAMERLTHSPFIMDVYGYCGQSAINELADFYSSFTNLEKFAKNLRYKNDPTITKLKLQVATMLAVGVSHIHEIDGPGDNATMVHYDLNPRNVAIVKGGRPKLNDFNVAEFLRWNTKTNERCGFVGRLHEPWWRAPEEMVIPPTFDRFAVSDRQRQHLLRNTPRLTEKVDIYSLGNLIQNIMTGRSPRGQLKPYRAAEVRALVIQGVPPVIPELFANSTDPAIVALREAVSHCFNFDPQQRWSAHAIAQEMLAALKKIAAEANATAAAEQKKEEASEGDEDEDESDEYEEEKG